MLNQTEELLRRLALNDENAVRRVLQSGPVSGRGSAIRLDLKTHALVRLGSLLSIGAGTDSCRLAVDLAHTSGATDEEIVGVLVAVGPAVGSARLVGAAPTLALAIGYDLDDDVV